MTEVECGWLGLVERWMFNVGCWTLSGMLNVVSGPLLAFFGGWFFGSYRRSTRQAWALARARPSAWALIGLLM
jgi:hypothetical protein